MTDVRVAVAGTVTPVRPGRGVRVEEPMSAEAATDPARIRRRLLTPTPRLGWVFRDRGQYRTPFTEPPPAPQPVPGHLYTAHQRAEQRWRKARRWSTAVSIGVFTLLVLLGGCAVLVSANSLGGPNIGMLIVSVLIAVVLSAPAVAVAATFYGLRQSAGNKINEAGQALRAQHAQQTAEWQRRKRAHEEAEFARVDNLEEWGPATVAPPARRVDVFGGSLWGWEAMLTVHGSSILAQQRLLVADLSGQLVCRELADTASNAGLRVRTYPLPSGLADTGLLAGLEPGQLADALTEAMHGEAEDGSRAARAVDARILEQLCEALGEQVSISRLTVALRAVLGHDDPGDVLTRAEHAHLATDLFTADYRREVQSHLVRIEAFLAPLARMAAGGSREEEDASASSRTETPPDLTCLAFEPQARNVRTELLAALIVQWLTVQVSAGQATPAVVIMGADEIHRAHLERLTEACERRGVSLTLAFRHLREASLSLLGGGSAAFMRLGNHQEAAAAADYIGRQYKFVLSQLTATLGGNQTHTQTDTEGATETDTTSRGKQEGWSRGPSDDFTGITAPVSTTGGTNVTESRSTSRNWSAALSWADGTNWSDARTTQRVYEYSVEPTVLQHLPDHALLLVTSGPDGQPYLQPVECDPSIVTLPRVSTRPLADAGRSPGGVAPITHHARRRA